MSTPSIVKQKAQYEKICEFKTEGFLFFPREDVLGVFHVISSTGELFQFNESTSEQIMTLNGHANGLCFDSNGFVYVTDLATNSINFKQIIQQDPNPIIENILAREYDGKSFKGPTSLAYNKEENVLYFADSGVFEDASLAPFDCSIYSIDLETRVLKKILGNLSFVSDICYDNNNNTLYIAETFMNRIVRLKLNDNGVFVGTVFYQFSGRIGPSAITIDENGNLFCARYEYSNSDIDMEIESDGLISVINKNGEMIGELNVPKLPEISGIYISPKKREDLLLTVRNSTAVFKIKISAFTGDLDKYEASMKI